VYAYIVKDPLFEKKKYYGNFAIIYSITSGTLYPGMYYTINTDTVNIMDIFTASYTIGSSTTTYYICSLSTTGMITYSNPPSQKLSITFKGTLITYDKTKTSTGLVNPGLFVTSGMTGSSYSYPPQLFPVNISVTSVGGSSTGPTGTTYSPLTGSTFYAQYAGCNNITSGPTGSTQIKGYVSIYTNSYYTFNSYWSGYTGSTMGVATGNGRYSYFVPGPIGNDTSYTSYNYGSTGYGGNAGFYTSLTNPSAGTAATPYMYTGTKIDNINWPSWTGHTSVYTTPTIYGGSTNSASPTGFIYINSNAIPVHPTADFIQTPSMPIETTTPYSAPAYYINQYNKDVTVVNYNFSANAGSNGYNNNNLPLSYGDHSGWCCDNAALFSQSNDLGQNATHLEPLDIFSEHVPNDGITHHHVMAPHIYNWVLDYTPRLLGFYFDGYPLVTPFLVYDTSTKSYRMINSADLNSNNGLVANVTFNFVSPSDSKTYYFKYDFCYVCTYAYPYTIGSYYGTPSAINKT